MKPWMAIVLMLVLVLVGGTALAEEYRDSMYDASGWESKIGAVKNPSLVFSTKSDDDAILFIAESPRSGMKWRKALATPVVDNGTYLHMRYRAERIDTDRDDDVLQVEDTNSSLYSVVPMKQLVADGEWHVVTINLKQAPARLIQALWVQVQSGGKGQGYLWIDEIAFSYDDTPNGSTAPEAQGGYTVAHMADLTWQAQPTWLDGAAKAYSLQRIPGPTGESGNAIRFAVEEAARGMKWTTDVGGAIDTSQMPHVTMHYRAGNIPRSGSGSAHGEYVLWIAGKSTINEGEIVEAIPFRFYELSDNQQWLTVTAAVPPMQIQTMAIQVQAAQPDAFLEISSLKFTSKTGKPSLIEPLSYTSGWSDGIVQDVEPLVLSTANLDITQVLNRGPYDATEWFAAEQVVIKTGHLSIPFAVNTKAPQLLGTPVYDIGSITVDLNRQVGTLYVLLAALFYGNEDSSQGKGAITSVQQVERFVAEIRYADKSTEKVFPQRVESGTHAIDQGLGVYAIVPGRDTAIESITFHDEMRNGAFYLAGISAARYRWDKAVMLKPQPATLRGNMSPMDPGEPAIQVADNIIRFSSNRMQLTLSVQSGLQITSMTNRITGAEMFSAPTPLFDLLVKEGLGANYTVARMDVTPSAAVINLQSADMDAQVIGQFTAAGDVTFSLTLTNMTQDVLYPSIQFPALQHIAIHRPGSPVEASELWYMYPKRGMYFSNTPTTLSAPYSGVYPLQFMDFYHRELGGLYSITQDLDLMPKTFAVEKTASGSGSLRVRYNRATQGLAPGHSVTLPDTVLGVHEGDWHAALTAYSDWIESWYAPLVPRKAWFQRVFHFRQQFLHGAFPEKSGMFNELDRTFHFEQALEKDRLAFGGVDYLHLFDWGWSPISGRVGDYDPWDYLGSPEKLKAAIAQVQAKGIPVGLYFEGYLLSPQSKIAQTMGRAWEMLDAQGNPDMGYAPEMTMSPHEPAWQDYLAQILYQAWEQTGAMGFYLDELGFNNTRKDGYARGSEVKVPQPLLRGEVDILQKARTALPPEVVLYTEENPVDVASQYQDGSFTYALAFSGDASFPGLNLFRFVFPDFKTIEIISVDNPLGSDYQSLKRVFFNGEAVWLMGTPDKWFSPEALAFLQKMNRVQRQYADAFTSLHPVPLVPTLYEGVYANAFPAEEGAAGEIVWTLYNANYRSVEGAVLAVPHIEGAAYVDIWNERALEPEIKDGMAYISVVIDPKGVGAVAQKR